MKKLIATLVLLLSLTPLVNAQETPEVSPQRISEYIQWYPAIKQAEMRDDWLEDFEQGQWQFTGKVSADDRTVITPQADVNYGYTWFNISEKPVVITMPDYEYYYSASIFDMNHFMEVVVGPEKPIVVRLANQKSPVEDAYEIVLETNQGLVFTRQTIVDNESEVLKLAEKITINGGGGDRPFIVPDFSEEEIAAGDAIIQDYGMKISNARKLFGSTNEGVGDLDRAAGVFLGQLGTQAYVVDYAQYVKDQNGQALNGTDSYEITVPAEALSKNDKGYWSLTIYNMEDRYLIPNEENRYVISSYKAKKNADGTVTLRINPEGKGENALPTASKAFYGVFRVYEPVQGLEFPSLEKVN